MVLIKTSSGKPQAPSLSARFALVFLALFSILDTTAQVLTVERVTAWENAGLTTELSAPTNQVLITDFGGDNTGVNSTNSAYTDAIASLNGNAGTIYFPQGEYLFTSSLSIPDSVFLKGASAETTLKFDLGGTGDLIRINGTIVSTEYALDQNGIKGTYEIELTDASELEVGNVIRLYQFDEDYMFSTWAYGTLGQVIKITEITGNVLTLADPLNHNYPLSRNPFLKKLNPVTSAGIECLKITREDATTDQTDNINVNYAFNCVIRNVEIENSNFAHIGISSSAHIQIEGCYLHHAHAYGGGGQGYGVATQYATSFCLIQNTVFEHLRHSMLIQAGANGNVFGYNYSYDPFWESGSLPQDAAGDAVLHGNYTYMNLFEGNTVQNIVIDASHGSNGSFNTFFRNRSELYGFFSDNSTTTDSMNVVGNVITNSGFPLGLFMLNGVGHYSYGNNHSGTAIPSNTTNISINSLYLNENDLPDFLSQEELPMAGYPLAMNQKLLPAESRFITEDYVECSSLITSSGFVQNDEGSKFVLKGNILEIDSSVLPATLDIYSINGALLQHQILTSTRETLSLPNGNGMFLIRTESLYGLERATFKHISFY